MDNLLETREQALALLVICRYESNAGSAEALELEIAINEYLDGDVSLSRWQYLVLVACQQAPALPERNADCWAWVARASREISRFVK